MDYSFFASLYSKPAITKDTSQISSSNIRKFKELDSHKLEKLEQANNSLKIEKPQNQANNLLKFNKFVQEENNSEKIENLKHEVNDSFIDFLQGVKEDYEKQNPQLCTALNKFAERYEAAKSQSIPRLASFLYDLNHNLDPSARTKGGKKIPVQVESIK
ncbi:6269_t:CDS:2 [Dentiscutata erythropus]|uniref:6269_t:CDS:1 n=1 Tax=Dentiscutata erythropus TaxID=1348616 RepID=A0A9N9IFH5_9GLOM|nr:6269_t:CDS:2 [Dentiscutata erythropus]